MCSAREISLAHAGIRLALSLPDLSPGGPNMKKFLILALLCAAFAVQAAYAARSQDVLSACPIGEDYDCGDDVVVIK
jgi:hypothetical protein